MRTRLNRAQAAASAFDPAHYGSADAVFGCNIGKPPRISADFDNTNFGQFGIGNGFSTSSLMPPLPHLVVNIILGAPKEQMIKINARRRIAVVADMPTSRNWAPQFRPKNSRHSSACTFVPELSITSVIGMARPKRASALIWWRRKAHYARAPWNQSVVFLGHVPIVPSDGCELGAVECLSTRRAVTFSIGWAQ